MKMATEINITSTENIVYNNTLSEYYKDSNDFMEAIKRKIIRLDISTKTKFDIIKLIALKKRKDLRGEVEWTSDERNQFFKKIENIEAKNIENENKKQEFDFILDNEITKEGIQSFINSTEKYKRNNDVNLSNEKQNKLQENIIVYEDNTVGDALEKINQSEHNFVILIDKSGKFKGIYIKHEIDSLDRSKSLSYISQKDSLIKKNIFGLSDITNENAGDMIRKYGITALPILNNENEGIVIGILGIRNLNKKSTKNTCILGITKLNLNRLKI